MSRSLAQIWSERIRLPSSSPPPTCTREGGLAITCWCLWNKETKKVKVRPSPVSLPSCSHIGVPGSTQVLATGRLVPRHVIYGALRINDTYDGLLQCYHSLLSPPSSCFAHEGHRSCTLFTFAVLYDLCSSHFNQSHHPAEMSSTEIGVSYLTCAPLPIRQGRLLQRLRSICAAINPSYVPWPAP